MTQNINEKQKPEIEELCIASIFKHMPSQIFKLLM